LVRRQFGEETGVKEALVSADNDRRAMGLDIASVKKPFNVDIPHVALPYTGNSTRSAAVLFTDIVDSTEYFKVHGDAGGREMLRRHEEIASPIIARHGGLVLKVLGDSVMAYFLDAREAVKSAIEIQQGHNVYNRDRNRESRIQVRVGIHYGSVIVEENDIYGEVVNAAAKLTNLADGEKVYVSEEVFKLVRELPCLHFELVNIWQKGQVPEGLTVYRVLWDDAADLNPATVAFARLRPLWTLGGDGFRRAWAAMLEPNSAPWQGKDVNEERLEDGSLVLIGRDGKTIFLLGQAILQYLREHTDGINGPLPVRVIIDTMPDFRQKEHIEAMDIDWKAVSPGEIYLTEEAYKAHKVELDQSVVPVQGLDGQRLFCRLAGQENLPCVRAEQFVYRTALGKGSCRPCFYCGDTRHEAVRCPSKGLPETTRALSRLGYLSVGRINELFLNYFLAEDGDVSKPFGENKTGAGHAVAVAYQAFQELKRIYQLRFLKTVWYGQSNDWNRLRETHCQSEGGLAWLAQDSLRVSDLDRAQSILSDALKKQPSDYRVHSVLGYLNIEKGDFLRAVECFNEALLHAGTTPQKIFILLLLCRIHTLTDNLPYALKSVTDILLLDPHCLDAVYQDIIFKFQQGKEKMASQRLMRLIEEQKEFYVCAVIDQDLAPFSHVIDPQLSSLAMKMRGDGKSSLQQAENEIERSANMLDERDIGEVKSLLAKAKAMIESDSYFGFLDAGRYCSTIMAICHNSMRDRKKAVLDRFHQLNDRIDRNLRVVASFHYPGLATQCHEELTRLKGELARGFAASNALPREQLNACNDLWQSLSGRASHLESKLGKLAIIENALVSLMGFAKHAAILLSVVLFIGIFILPVSSYYVNVVLLDMDVSSTGSMWSYQKPFLVFGGVVSLIISSLLTLKNMFKG
jgi:class 3 adenylate cyclase/tetratricopeptide (TPR) repeat protein